MVEVEPSSLSLELLYGLKLMLKITGCRRVGNSCGTLAEGGLEFCKMKPTFLGMLGRLRFVLGKLLLGIWQSFKKLLPCQHHVKWGWGS